MKTIDKYSLEFIEWEDSTSGRKNGWTDIEDMNLAHHSIISVGFVILEDESAICIVPNISIGEDEKLSYLGADDTVIPISAIRNRFIIPINTIQKLGTKLIPSYGMEWLTVGDTIDKDTQYLANQGIGGREFRFVSEASIGNQVSTELFYAKEIKL